MLKHLVSLLLVVVVSATALASPSGARAADGSAVNSLGLTARYDTTATLAWQAATLTVESVALVRNTTTDPVDQLAFNLVTLRTGAAKLTRAAVAGTSVEPAVSGQTIVVDLPTPLAPDASTSVTIAYRARFNAMSGEMGALFVKDAGIVTSYRWIPWLSREQQFGAPSFGETWVTAVSPRVRVWLKSDVPVKFATTGSFKGRSDGAQLFVARGVRDFNFSASPQYELHKVTWRGRTLRFYTRTLPVDTLVSHTIATLNRMSDLVGEYPYDRLTVAEMPKGTGMESPAMHWISSKMSGSRLRYMVVHEVAHQWFYSAVGSNQATEPFADEAVSDFFTRDQLGMFRQPTCATSRLDRSVYDYSAACYNEVVYVQGGLYLRAYRAEVDATKFWAGLRNYVREYDGRLGGTRKLLDALDAASGYDSSRHAARFPSLYP